MLVLGAIDWLAHSDSNQPAKLVSLREILLGL
jgi:hypothetical protein